MNDKDEKRLIQDALNRSLSGLQGNPFLASRIIASEKGEKKMKKKLSVGLVAVVVLLAMTTTALAASLLPSNILRWLFNTEEAAPQEVTDLLNQPEQTEKTALANLTLNEYLFDGSSLYVTLNLQNPTQDQYVYSIPKVWVNGRRLSIGTGFSLFSSDLLAQCLGGEAEGAPLSRESTQYASFTGIYDVTDAEFYGAVPVTTLPPLPEGSVYEMAPRFLMPSPLTPMGSAVLTFQLEVYRPLVEARFYSYSASSLPDPRSILLNGCLPVCQEDGSVPIGELASVQEWLESPPLELVATEQLSFSIDMQASGLTTVSAQPGEYQNEEYTLELQSLTLTHTGGELAARVIPTLDSFQRFPDHDAAIIGNTDIWVFPEEAYLALKAGQPLSAPYNGAVSPSGATVGVSEEEDGVLIYDTNIHFHPISGDLPQTVYLLWATDTLHWDLDTAIRVEMK